MFRSRPRTLLAGATVLPLTAMALAGPSAAAAPPQAAKAASTPTVKVANSSLGRILVDAHGRTVYLFKKDTTTKSRCSGACAQAWPPVLVSGKPKAGSGAKASLLGTTKRSDGKTQVTYNRHPLYRFDGDQTRGDTNGEGLTAFGASWFVVSPAGKQVAASAGSGSSPGSSGVY